jgi:hypothetical protein
MHDNKNVAIINPCFCGVSMLIMKLEINTETDNISPVMNVMYPCWVIWYLPILYVFPTVSFI